MSTEKQKEYYKQYYLANKEAVDKCKKAWRAKNKEREKESSHARYIKNKEKLIPLFFGTMAYCFCFWGVSSIFHTAEGYPPQWFFWVTVTPPFIAAVLIVFNIEKKN